MTWTGKPILKCGPLVVVVVLHHSREEQCGRNVTLSELLGMT